MIVVYSSSTKFHYLASFSFSTYLEVRKMNDLIKLAVGVGCGISSKNRVLLGLGLSIAPIWHSLVIPLFFSGLLKTLY